MVFHPSFYKSAISLIETVYHLFVHCLSQAYLPKEWHNHDITPIPKSQDKSRVDNYQPISLLFMLSKVQERLVFDKVSDFIFTNCISPHQFGFVSNYSTLQQLLKYLNFVHKWYDNCNQVDTIYLDICKAFDSIPHHKLLSKLWQVGFTGSLWKFSKCYLTDCRQHVKIDGVVSDRLPDASGVPQGNILGTLLFKIYYLFADTKCCNKISSSRDIISLQDLNCFYA